MSKIIINFILFLIIISSLFLGMGSSYHDFKYSPDYLIRVSDSLDRNNIKTYIWNSGVFNQKLNINQAGFNWPRGTSTYAIYTSGLTVAGYVNNQLRMAAASYTGEYAPGYCINGTFYTNSNFKIYKVSRGDNMNNNGDWLHWGLMVPYGAPFVDVNHNGTYEPAIDTPGVRGAVQTIFFCMTDADSTTHSQSEGFAGGTRPLGAEVHLTAWAYDNPGYSDMQFLKYEIINKNTTRWDSTFFSVFCDPDLGFANDDYNGCDTVRNMTYCYNASNQDGTGQGNSYGLDPPAVGIRFLNCGTSNVRLTSSICIRCACTGAPSCEMDASSPTEAYNYMKGLKKDATSFVIPLTSPPHITKYNYSGDPEAGNGWTAYLGSVLNCGGQLTGQYEVPTDPQDIRFLMTYGTNDLIINPGDTQKITLVQLIARGSNNKNSVTKLKQLSDTAQVLCQNGFVIGITPISIQIPEKFSLYQNYPNPFNPETKIKFEVPLVGNGRDRSVQLKIYNALGQEVAALVNESFKPGTYSVDWNAANFPSGVYFYKMDAGDYTETKKMVLLK